MAKKRKGGRKCRVANNSEQELAPPAIESLDDLIRIDPQLYELSQTEDAYELGKSVERRFLEIGALERVIQNWDGFLVDALPSHWKQVLRDDMLYTYRLIALEGRYAGQTFVQGISEELWLCYWYGKMAEWENLVV